MEFPMAAANGGWNLTALYDTYYGGLTVDVIDKPAACELPTKLDLSYLLGHPV